MIEGKTLASPRLYEPAPTAGSRQWHPSQDPCKAYQRALDHFQSTTRPVRQRRIGLRWM
jgi:hypothetical protein